MGDGDVVADGRDVAGETADVEEAAVEDNDAVADGRDVA